MRSLWKGAIVLSALVLTGSSAVAQYPDRPIRVISPYAPGGLDLQIRTLEPSLRAILGQPLVLESRGGAGAALGSAAVARAPNDGYTLLFAGTQAITLAPNLRKVTYDASDFEPIGTATGTEIVVAARANAPFASLTEMVSYARANPGKINMATSGFGSATHLVGERIQAAAGIKFTHVPFKGLGESVLATVGGATDIVLGFAAPMIGQVTAGNLRLITTTGSERSEFFPEVPTLHESGIDVVEIARVSLLAPKDTPHAIRQRLEQAFATAVQAPAFEAEMRKTWTKRAYLSAEETRRFLATESAFWASFLKQLGLAKLED